MTKPATLPFMFSGRRLSLGLAVVGDRGGGDADGNARRGFLWQGYNSLIYSHILLHAAQDQQACVRTFPVRVEGGVVMLAVERVTA